MYLFLLIFVQTFIGLLFNLEKTAAEDYQYDYYRFDGELTDTEFAFIHNDFIKDGVISSPPYSWLTVRFQDLEIYPGRKISPLQVLQPPSYIEWDCDYRRNYTLAMCDPDVPITTPDKPYLFWFVENIPNCDVNQGDERVKYFPPTPPPGKVHRYAFLLWDLGYLPSQNALDTTTKLTRGGFSPKELSYIYGAPSYAGTFYRAETNAVSEVSGLTGLL